MSLLYRRSSGNSSNGSPHESCLSSGSQAEPATELAGQIDFHIFDREMSHAKTKSFLEVAQGNAHGVETVAVEQMGKEIGQLHKDTAATFADDRDGKRKRGRPRKVRPKKRARYDAWNSFVALNRPAVALELMGQEIKKGEIMKRFGERWGSLPDSEKKNYDQNAISESMKRQINAMYNLESLEAAQESQPNPLGTTNWYCHCRICTHSSPLAPDLLLDPPANAANNRTVEEWSQELMLEVPHLDSD